MEFAAGRSRVRHPILAAGCFIPIGLVFAAAGLIFAAFAGREAYFYARLKFVDGREVQGTVLFTKETTDGDGSTYRAGFGYLPVGDIGPLAGDHQIHEETFRRLRQGDAVNVVYSAGRPTISRIDGAAWQSPLIFLIAAGFILVWMTMPVWFLWMGLKEIYLRRLLASEGRIVPGRIVYASSKRDTDDGYVVTIRFEFSAPTGQIAQGEASATLEDLRGADLPRIGTGVLVMAAEEKNFAML